MKKIVFTHLEHKTVNSTVIHSLAYKKNTLELKFCSGAYYQYYHISAEIVYNLQNSTSCGKFFNDRIKNNYKFKRINK